MADNPRKAAQDENGTRIPVHCKYCKNCFYVRPSMYTKFAYCGKVCRVAHAAKLLVERKEIIITNWGKVSNDKIAIMCGLSLDRMIALKKEINKAGGGLINLNSLKVRNPRKPRERKITPPKPAKQHKPRRVEPQMPTRVIDESQYHYVKVDAKTYVQRKNINL